MKKIILILFQILIFVMGINARLTIKGLPYTGTIVDKTKYENSIVGVWYGKTYKYAINIPVVFTANFKQNRLFHLKVEVMGFDYDNVYGNYRFLKNNKLLKLVGWRKRTESKKIFIFRVLKFKEREIRLSLIGERKEIKNTEKPIQFFPDKSMLEYIKP